MRAEASVLLLLAAGGYRVSCDCDGPLDPLPLDAGEPPVDAGLLDAGFRDAGVADTGFADAGRAGADSGDADAGNPCRDIQFVQAVPGTQKYQVMQSQTSESQTITLTPGNLLVAIAYSGQGPGGGGTSEASTSPNMQYLVTDSQGDEYFAGPYIEDGVHHWSAMQIYFAPNVKGGMTSVTVQSDAGVPLNPFTGLLLEEYSGLATSDVADIASVVVAPTSTSTVSTAPMTTRAACSLVIAGFTDGDVPGEPLITDGGWPIRSTDLWDPGAVFDNGPAWAVGGSLVGGAVVQESFPTSDTWVATQLAFRSALSPVLPQPTAIGFQTSPQTVPVNSCSAAVVLQSVSNGELVPTGSGIAVRLSAPNLSLFADPACAFPVTSVYVGAGTGTRPFYFRSQSSAATPVITATAPGFSTIWQTETIQ
jgi:hypothetical protein